MHLKCFVDERVQHAFNLRSKTPSAQQPQRQRVVEESLFCFHWRQLALDLALTAFTRTPFKADNKVKIHHPYILPT